MYHAKEAQAGDGRMLGRRELLKRAPHLDLASWEAVNADFPVGVTRAFSLAMNLADPRDPVALQVLPDARELQADSGDRMDPVGDAARSPVPWVVQKHADRVLLLVTKRCKVYCRYCFRRDHDPGQAMDPSPEEWEAALDWCLASGARELILSGGDPLAVRNERLLETLDRLQPAFHRTRIHTRAPIVAPERIDEDLVAGLAQRGPIWVVVHCNHPRELQGKVKDALARLVEAGIPLLNQAVLLKGVNDTVDTLAELGEALLEARVKPYYLHQVDPVPGNAHFRVDAHRALALHRGLAQRVSGLALPRLVVDLPGGEGKISLDRAVAEGRLR